VRVRGKIGVGLRSVGRKGNVIRRSPGAPNAEAAVQAGEGVESHPVPHGDRKTRHGAEGNLRAIQEGAAVVRGGINGSVLGPIWFCSSDAFAFVSWVRFSLLYFCCFCIVVVKLNL